MSGNLPTAAKARQELKEALHAAAVADARNPVTPFMAGHRQFLDALAKQFPDFVKRLSDYMMAPVNHVVLPNGQISKQVDPVDDLTEGQVILFRAILNKLLPSHTITSGTNQPANPVPQGGTINISIHTVGPALDPHRMPGVDGVVSGQAVPTAKITFHAPKVIDVEPQSEEETDSGQADARGP